MQTYPDQLLQRSHDRSSGSVLFFSTQTTLLSFFVKVAIAERDLPVPMVALVPVVLFVVGYQLNTPRSLHVLLPTRWPTSCRMALPDVGAKLPLPSVSFVGLSAVPGPVSSLSELTANAELLMLVVTTEGAMTDQLRQTLVGLQDIATESARVAAVSMVAPTTYQKLTRKAKVEYPLLSDPGRQWLAGLGAAPDGSVSVLLVDAPSSVILKRWDGRGKVPQTLSEIGAAVAKGRAALGSEVREQLAAAAAVSAAKAAKEAAALAAKELEQQAAQRAAEEKVRAKAEAQRRQQEEIEALNRQMAEKLANEQAAKEAVKKAKEAKREATQQGTQSKANKIKEAQKAQKAEKAVKVAVTAPPLTAAAAVKAPRARRPARPQWLPPPPPPAARAAPL
jgi:hypothetical protein